MPRIILPGRQQQQYRQQQNRPNVNMPVPSTPMIPQPPQVLSDLASRVSPHNLSRPLAAAAINYGFETGQLRHLGKDLENRGDNTRASLLRPLEAEQVQRASDYRGLARQRSNALSDIASQFNQQQNDANNRFAQTRQSINDRLAQLNQAQQDLANNITQENTNFNNRNIEFDRTISDANSRMQSLKSENR
jgi:uncharacterized phage infection (PIP) family protein YhgE